MQRRWSGMLRIAALLAVLALIVAACGDDGDTGDAGDDTTAPQTTAATDGTETTMADTDTTMADTDTTAAAAPDTTAAAQEGCVEFEDVRLQLQWFAQAQFGGYYAAVDEGLYEEECLNVTILEGGVDIVPQQVLATGGAEFALAWVPKALESIQGGADIVNIAQVFERSGTLQVAFADSGIGSVADLAGKKVGNWGFGNEYEVFAALEQAGIFDQVEHVGQDFTMNALLNGEIDAAEAMIYNEYAQVLEAVNPDTGELYQPEDLVVIDYNDVGTAMLQDAVWAERSWLAENEDIAERFLRASFRGWIWCRDNPDACVDVVLNNGSTLGLSHQTWQLNEINGLIWPASNGIGVMNQDLWDQTVEIATAWVPALQGAEISADAFRTDLAQAAVDALAAEGLDVTGNNWQRVEVELVEGGS